MLKKEFVHGLLGVCAVAAALAAMAVQAQSTGNQTGTATGAQTGSQSGSPTAGQASGQSGATASTASGGTSVTLGRADRKIVMNMAQQHMAEIEAGRLAQQKSLNEQVKNFAQQLIDDHTRALGEVKQLAQARNITLPTELDRTHRTQAKRLAALEGEAFDRVYLERAGVSEHKKTHGMLRQAQSRAKDPELKALAARTLPIVEQHLNSAQQLHKHTARGGSGASGATGSSQQQRPQQQQPADRPGQ